MRQYFFFLYYFLNQDIFFSFFFLLNWVFLKFAYFFFLVKAGKKLEKGQICLESRYFFRKLFFHLTNKRPTHPHRRFQNYFLDPPRPTIKFYHPLKKFIQFNCVKQCVVVTEHVKRSAVLLYSVFLPQRVVSRLIHPWPYMFFYKQHVYK